MEGILYYKDDVGNKIPIDYFRSCDFILNERQRNRKNEVYTREFERTKELKRQLDMYEQKTLYLLVQGTEFLVKDD